MRRQGSSYAAAKAVKPDEVKGAGNVPRWAREERETMVAETRDHRGETT